MIYCKDKKEMYYFAESCIQNVFETLESLLIWLKKKYSTSAETCKNFEKMDNSDDR